MLLVGNTELLRGGKRVLYRHRFGSKEPAPIDAELQRAVVTLCCKSSRQSLDWLLFYCTTVVHSRTSVLYAFVRPPDNILSLLPRALLSAEDPLLSVRRGNKVTD